MKAKNVRNGNEVELVRLGDFWELTENGNTRVINDANRKRWYRIIEAAEEPVVETPVVEPTVIEQAATDSNEITMLYDCEVSKPEQKTQKWHMLFTIPGGYTLLITDIKCKTPDYVRGTIKTELKNSGGTVISSSYSTRSTLEKVFDNAHEIVKTIMSIRKAHFKSLKAKK